MATMKDIALRTGVSVATVSNVLNGKPGAASDSKAQEIFTIAQELHYHPNSFAKNLKLRRSNSIGIITEDLTVFNTPEIVDGIESYCEEHGYEIIVDNMRLFKRYKNDFTDTPQHSRYFENALSTLVSKQVEGIVYVGYHCREISFLPTFGDIPFVYAYCFPKGGGFSSVYPDDENAGYHVGQTLIRCGHRKIGVIVGPVTSIHAQSRLCGFQRALLENQILYNPETTFWGDWSRNSGYEIAEKLLSMDITAIFAMNDLMTSGVYTYCLEHNIAVGRDISLFGYDNRDIVDLYSPAISSVAPPLHEIGRRSAELVLRQIQSNTLINERFLLPCSVHLRDSVVRI